MLLAVASVSLLWGLNWPVMKEVVQEIPPWSFRVISVYGAGIVLLLLARATGEPMRVHSKLWLPLALVALFGVTGWHMLTAFGLRSMGGGRAAIVAYTMPIWTAILGAIVLRERPKPRQLAALAVGMLAMAILIAPDLARLGRAPEGVLLVTGAAFCWGASIVAMKAFDWQLGPMALSGWQLLVGGVPILAGWAMLEAWPDLGGASATAWACLAYVTLVSLVFCFSTHVRLIQLLPASVAALSMLAIPVVGLLSSAVLVGEPVGPGEVAALALVLVSLGLVLLPSRA